MHVLVPGDWTVRRGHELAEQLESAVRSAVPESSVVTHVEPLEPAAPLDDLVERRRVRAD